MTPLCEALLDRPEARFPEAQQIVTVDRAIERAVSELCRGYGSVEPNHRGVAALVLDVDVLDEASCEDAADD